MMLRNCFAVLLVAALAACSGTGSKTTDYKSGQSKTAQPLEVPPELTSPTMDDRYSIPDPRQQTTYSSYSQKIAPGAAAEAPKMPAVLPKFEGVRVERYNDQRWLVVKGDPEKVWPVVREFWIDAGYKLAREAPELGLMETDWYEDRAQIPQDIVRRTVGKLIEGMYSTPRRDKYRTRLEKGVEPGTTEVYVSNRNFEEVYTNNTQDSTKWMPRPADRELEAEMLTRIAEKLGAGETKVTTASAPLPGRKGLATPVARPAQPAQPSNAVLENNGAGPLVVNDGFDRAWRRVGLALDRSGFTVEDRDRSKGLFFVRYIDPDAELQAGEKKSWTEKLAFWHTPAKNQPQYRIHVADAGASMSQVQVQDAKGSPEASSTGKKILGLLYEQLK
jgi:outer membrane protein assembly factor BamC